MAQELTQGLGTADLLPSTAQGLTQGLGTADLLPFKRGLKKPANCNKSSRETCSNRRLIMPGMVGNGVVVSDGVIVSKDATGDFTTIGDAVGAAPENLGPDDGYFVIYIKRGVYVEYVSISKMKTNVLLLGDGINSTIITGSHSNANGWGTSNSATFAVAGDRFLAIDITFRNTYGEGSQAVAVRNQADQSTFFQCSFEGHQDTLDINSMSQFYRNCDVYGNIDFIFGDASAVFQNCRILCRRRGGRGSSHAIMVAAHGRNQPDENTGISFHNCTIDAAPDLAEDLRHQDRKPGFLGRPWKPYARTVYMQSYIGGLINSEGWLKMNGSMGLDTLYYGEYKNYGPGSETSKRVNWRGVKSQMSEAEALAFTVQNFTDGGSWLPRTGVPFVPGLL